MTKTYNDLLIEMKTLIDDCYRITIHEPDDNIWGSQITEKFVRLNSLLATMNESKPNLLQRIRIKKLNKLVTEFINDMTEVRNAN